MKVTIISFFAFLVTVLVLPVLGQQDKTVQEEQPEIIEEKLYLSVFEIQPEFPGGHEAMLAFLTENLNYSGVQKKLKGRTVLDFIVTKDGELKEIRILKSLEPGFDLAAIQAVKEMPHWIPAKSKDGKPVNVRYVLPVQFNQEQNRKSKRKQKQKFK